jgi:hypothetical protein
MKLATIAFLLIAAACGTDKKHKDDPPIIEPQVSAEATPVAPVSPVVEASPVTESPAPEPEPAKPVFDKDKYLAGQEADLLEFVAGLKAIKVYDAPPAFLQPTSEQSKVGVHYGAPFTSVEPLYREHIYESPSNYQGCSGLPVGTLHHQLTALWEVGTAVRPLGLEYRLFVIIQNGALAIVAVDAHWKTLDGKHHYYDLGVTCEDGTPVIPTISEATF